MTDTTAASANAAPPHSPPGFPPRPARPLSRRFVVAMTLAAAVTVTIALVYLVVGAIVCSAPLWLPRMLAAGGLG